MLFLTLLISVEKAHVTFATAPEHVVGTTEFDSCVDCVLDLNGSASHYVKVRVGSGTVHIAAVAKHICSTPKILDAGLSHLLLQVSNDFLHIVLILLNRSAFAHEVNIVEAEILDAHFLHELKAGVSLLLCDLHCVSAFVPGELLCSAAELVAAFCAKCVPPSHSELQPIFHFLAENHLLSVIVTICERILALFAFKLDFSYPGKILFSCHNCKLCFRLTVLFLFVYFISDSSISFHLPYASAYA